jgi:hypothetical protein
MGIFDKLRGWVSGAPRATAKRYDNVRIVNLADGTTIEGHDAVVAHIDAEQKLLDAHGSSITFQVYRVNLEAKSIAEVQGDRLAEIKVGGDFVSGTDTVADVKAKLRPLLARSAGEAGARPELRLRQNDRISFSFSNRPMADDKRFYADHFMLLPVWVQVLLHECDYDELMELARRLHAAARQ